MRILNINYEFPPLGGGGGVAHFLIARELAKRHDVDVVTSHFANLPRYEEKDGVHVFRVPVVGRNSSSTATLPSLVTFPLPALFKACQLNRQQQYDVVHSYFAVPSGVAGLAAARCAGVPHLLTIIGGDVYDPTKRLSPNHHALLRWVVSLIINRSDAVAAISTDIRKRALSLARVSKPISVILLGLDGAAANAGLGHRAARDQLGYASGDFLVVTVARLVKRKSLDSLIRSVSLVPDPRLKAVIIGDGPERAPLQALGSDLGVDQRIRFTGFLPEEHKTRYLSISDAFVLPSLHEGLGLVYIEAMKHGLPVIASKNGGQTDFLTEGETGFLVEARDPQKLAERIRQLMEDGALSRRIGTHNQEVAASLRADRAAVRYEQLYRDLVSRQVAVSGGNDGDAQLL